MNNKIAVLTVLAVLCGGVASRADFKYTESSKVTGGMMTGMMKLAGAFSKQAGEPIVTTHYVKGNRMKTEHSTGEADVIDLDGRRVIHIDTQKRTYSVMTFEQMKAALEKTQETLKEKGVKMVPKFEVTPTNNTKVILGQTTREVKVKIDMQMEAQESQPQGPAQNVAVALTADMWIAPTVKGYDEVRQFQERMAKELNWAPGAAFGGDPKMAEAMLELRRHAATLNGIPLLQLASMGMAGMPPGMGATGTSAQREKTKGTQSAESVTPEVTPSKDETPEVAAQKVVNPRDALKKGLGGVFGGFGRKEKKQEQPAPEPTPQAQSSAREPSAAEPGPAGPGGSGSMMEITTEVTAFSTDPLDSSVFDVPAGYKQVQADAEKVLSGRR